MGCRSSPTAWRPMRCQAGSCEGRDISHRIDEQYCESSACDVRLKGTQSPTSPIAPEVYLSGADTPPRNRQSIDWPARELTFVTVACGSNSVERPAIQAATNPASLSALPS